MRREEIAVLSKQTAVSSEFLAEIGRITVHFAILERDLTELTHGLLGLPERAARTITSELSFRGLQNLVASLVKEKHPAMASQFKDLLKLIASCEAKRNQISHSLWGAALTQSKDKRKVVRTKYSAKQQRGLMFQREEMTVEDLWAIASEISIAAFEVESFHGSIRRNDV